MNLFPLSKKHSVQYSIVDEGEIKEHSLGVWQNVDKYPNFAKTFACPAVNSVDNRIFTINSPVTCEVTFGMGFDGPYFNYEFDTKIHPVETDVHSLIKGIFQVENQKGLSVFQIMAPYVFITDDELNITTFGPNLKTENVLYVPGSLNIRNWIRNLNSAWTLIDQNREGKVWFDVDKPMIQLLFDKPIDLFYSPMTQIQKDYYRNIRGILKSRSNMNKLFKHIVVRRPKKLL